MTNHFTWLNQDVIQHIFSFVPVSDLQKVLTVCKVFSQQSKGQHVWRLQCQNIWESKYAKICPWDIVQEFENKSRFKDLEIDWLFLARCMSSASDNQQTILIGDTLRVGEFHESIANGIGLYADKAKVYYGQWKNGVEHGRGHYVWNDTRATFSGNFENGMRKGHGCWVSGPKDRMYDGNFEENRCHGHGKMYWFKTGIIYDGNWENGCPLDRKRAIVPQLQAVLDQRICTSLEFGKNNDKFGQFYYRCGKCVKWFCESCYDVCDTCENTEEIAMMPGYFSNFVCECAVSEDPKHTCQCLKKKE